jgi:hypothetical protein
LRQVSDGNQKTSSEKTSCKKASCQKVCGEKAIEQASQEICGEFKTLGKIGAVGKVSAASTARPTKCGSTGERLIGDVAVDNAATTRQDLNDG